MDISSIWGKLKKSPKDIKKFLALELTNEITQAAVWQVEDGKTEVVAIGNLVEWKQGDAGEQELITAIDATISNATEGLEVEPTGIVFGVTSDWATDDKFHPDKLKIIRQICKELELEPLGFVTITAALNKYLKMQEGTPASAILVLITRESVVVSLINQGAIKASELMVKSGNIISDVVEGITRFGKVELPSRIILEGPLQNLDEEVQKLLSYDWQSKFSFVHTPKIESLPKDLTIKSIAVAGGSEVAKSIGFEILEDEEVTLASGDQKTSDNTEQVLSAEEIGFTKSKKSRPPAVHQMQQVTLDEYDEVIEEDEGLLANDPTSSQSVSANKQSLARFIPDWSTWSLANFKKPALLSALLIVALVSVLAYFLWSIPKVTIYAEVEPLELPENVTFTLSTEAQAVDTTNFVVPSNSTQVEVEGSESSPTSGEKLVGDRAKGQITLYNRSTLDKTFAAGTTLSSGNVEFTLDEDVTVSKKTVGPDYVDVPGQKVASITASAIGEESNLASGQEFAVASFSKETYVAKNNDALSGGNSRVVQVVNKNDLDNLRAKLIARLKEEAQLSLENQVDDQSGIHILEELAEVIDESYSSKVGDETSTVTAEIKLRVPAITYSVRDVESLLTQALTAKIPSDHTRTDNPPRVEFGEILSEDEKEIKTEAKVIVDLIPSFDTTSLRESLKGKSGQEIDYVLSGIRGFRRSELEYSPEWLPPRLRSVPRNINNIELLIRAEN